MPKNTGNSNCPTCGEVKSDVSFECHKCASARRAVGFKNTLQFAKLRIGHRRYWDERRKMANLQRTETILKFQGYNVGDNPTFAQDADEENRRTTVVDLDQTVWRDMGNPAVITVTIVPGDALNE